MSNFLGPLCAILATLGFSSRAIFIKFVYQGTDIDPTTLLALRMIFSVPFFILMIFWPQRSPATRFSRNDWLKIGGLGLTGFYLSSYLDLSGLQYISASLERLILFLYPTMVVLLTAVLARRRVSIVELLAILLSYAGIAAVFFEDLSKHDVVKDTIWLGGGLIFAAAITYAIYLVGSQGMVKKIGAMRYTGWVMLFSSLAAIAQFALLHSPATLAQAKPVIGLIVMIALFGTVLPTWLLAEAIKRSGANRTAVICTVGPVATIGLDAWLLGESISMIQMGGAALVIGGVTLLALRPPKAGVKS
ncbi:MAG: DMT family transporter [Pseudomonadota bacterium]